VEARQKKAYTYFHDGLVNNRMFRAKDKTPYEDSQASQVFLDPTVRVAHDSKTGTYKYPTTAPKATPAETKKLEETRTMVESLAKAQATANSKVGVDIELVNAINTSNDTFIERNFTTSECTYCAKAGNPQASFAGRWSAKEAVFKSLGVQGKGAGAPLKDIEIVSDRNGAPTVRLHGDAKAAADKAGVKSVSVSISHTEEQVVAIAVSHF